MNVPVLAALLILGLFGGMLLFLELGRRLAVVRRATSPDGGGQGLGAVEGAMFGLMGLLLAFTFSGAAGRFDARRHLIVEEANAIGTAYLRLDLLPPAAQPALRELFRRYVDTRRAADRALPDLPAAQAELDRAAALQGEIWSRAVAAAQTTPTTAATMLLVPALNAMIDISTTRPMAARMHVPPLVFALLGVLALVCSLLAGYGMAVSPSRSWFHILTFAVNRPLPGAAHEWNGEADLAAESPHVDRAHEPARDRPHIGARVLDRHRGVEEEVAARIARCHHHEARAHGGVGQRPRLQLLCPHRCGDQHRREATAPRSPTSRHPPSVARWNMDGGRGVRTPSNRPLTCTDTRGRHERSPHHARHRRRLP
ncbi:MAG: hypothetical protein ACREMV_05320, partial [Gemmatimonadales bacterium]